MDRAGVVLLSLHLKESEELKATGRIVVGPSGAYAYCFTTSKSENVGASEGHLGNLFFPLGHDVERFVSYGWHGKPEGVPVEADEPCES